MHPDLEQMIALQRVDTELKRVRDELAATPKHIASLAALSAAAQAKVLGLDERLAAEEKLRRGHESDITDRKNKAARLRRQLDGATTAAQISALEHEIGFSTSEVTRLEDAEIESMERTETLTADRERAAEDMVAAETRLETERLRAADTVARDQAATAELERERGELRAHISEPSLATYDRVRKARGSAVAEGVDGKCSACQMMVRLQRWNDLRDRSNHELLMLCESCGRFLYWDPARDTPVPRTAQAGGGAQAR